MARKRSAVTPASGAKRRRIVRSDSTRDGYSVLVEVPGGQTAADEVLFAAVKAAGLTRPAPIMPPVAIPPTAHSDGPTTIRRVPLASAAEAERLRHALDGRGRIWSNPRFEPSGCPFGSCDCTPDTAKGTLADVAASIRATRVHAAGITGKVVVGVLDLGLRAEGRMSAKLGRRLLPNVIGGWVDDWGILDPDGMWHGNMVGNAVLAIAPGAKLVDMRVGSARSGNADTSDLTGAFVWARDTHLRGGGPHIVVCCMNVVEGNSDASTDPRHPLNRAVQAAIDAGVIVVWAAGNCGDGCVGPKGRSSKCVSYGPGRSIWGPAGLEQVICVGAINLNDEYAGYSSAGPAALAYYKPDLCGPTNFLGFNTLIKAEVPDTGTSASAPIVAGVVALMKEVFPNLTPGEARATLRATARDVGHPGFDHWTGMGAVNAYKAVSRFALLPRQSLPRLIWWRDIPPWPPRLTSIPAPIDWDLRSDEFDIEERLDSTRAEVAQLKQDVARLAAKLQRLEKREK